MKNEITKPEQELPKKTSGVFIFFQTAPSILLLICAVFAIFVGMRFLAFLDRTESHRSSISNKWSETGFEQLQQMNATIKQELDLILDQRRENQVLQARLQELTAPALKLIAESIPSPKAQELVTSIPQNKVEAVSASTAQGGKK